MVFLSNAPVRWKSFDGVRLEYRRIWQNNAHPEDLVEDTDYDLVSHDVLLALGSTGHRRLKSVVFTLFIKTLRHLHRTENGIPTVDRTQFRERSCETYSWGMLVRTRKEGFKA